MCEFEDGMRLEYDFSRGIRGKHMSPVIGVDECGVGSLAGPVIAGAVLWESQYFFEGLNDSKKLTLRQREDLYKRFEESNLVFATGSANIYAIVAYGIQHATLIAMRMAIDSVLKKSDQKYPKIILIDGKKYLGGFIGLPIKQRWIVKGDTKIPAIMAASIVAKVLRDRSIKNLVEKFPEYEKYGWRTNVGYGTKKHLEAIKKHGITPLHRQTFDPIKTWIKEGIIK
jgi:ribonuclease HII